MLRWLSMMTLALAAAAPACNARPVRAGATGTAGESPRPVEPPAAAAATSGDGLCGYEFVPSDPGFADSYRERNALVDAAVEGPTPEPPDVGVVLALDGPERSFPAGGVVRLLGAVSADLDLLRECPGGLLAHVELTLRRVDRGCHETAPLVVSDVELRAPEPSGTTADHPSYRESTAFAFDVARFFGIPAEPGSYAIVARVGRHESAPVTFDVVRD